MGEFFRRFFQAVASLLQKLFGQDRRGSDRDDPAQPLTPAETDSQLTIAPVVVARVEPTFTDIDLPALSGQLRLEELGQESGRQNLPASDSTSLDPVEQRIVELIQNRILKVRSEYELADQNLATASRTAEIDAGISRVRDMVEESLVDLRTQARLSHDEVYVRRERAQRCKQEVKDFREENGLKREAQPNRTRHPRVFALLGLIAIEGLFNGSILARGLEGGLIAGWVLAVCLAAMNTVTAFLFGWMVHNLAHIKLVRKLAGAFVVVGWIGWMLTFNLGVAHYRDALGGQDPDTAGVTALEQLRMHPLSVRDFQSTMLLALGILFSALAFYDGFGMDDSYPGYGAVTRKWEEACEEFQEVKKSELLNLSILRDQKTSRIRAEIDYLANMNSRLPDEIQRRRALAARWEHDMERLERAANTMVATYREANRRVRSSTPPAHFGLPLSMARPDNPVSVDLDEGRKQSLEVISDASTAITREYEAAIKSLPTLEEL
jgi:hypothetical protein